MADRDVIVVGGGVVGASAALLLAGLNYRVALIERRAPAFRPGRLGFDSRTVAVNAASRQLLEKAGIWDELPLQPITEMRVWESVGTAAISFDAATAGVEALAWVVEVGRLSEALWHACGEHLEVVAPATVEHLQAEAEQVVVSVGGAAMTAKLVIGADGASSQIRELAGATQQAYAVGELALATVARCAEAHEGRAFQRFGESGPLALLPLYEPDAVSVIWSLSQQQAQPLRELPAEAFAGALTGATESVLGNVLEVDEVAAFPLGQALVDDFNPAQRVLVIGDAARTLHPLAGQGVNLGLEDARGVSVAAAADRGDLGAPLRWRRFARRRRARAQMMLALMAGFDRLYREDNAGLRWLRNVGVRVADQTPLLKRQLIREAMGLGGIASSL